MVVAAGASMTDGNSLVLTHHRGILLGLVLKRGLGQIMAADNTWRSCWSFQIGRGNSVPRFFMSSLSHV